MGCIIVECILGDVLFPYDNNKDYVVMLYELIGEIPNNIINKNEEYFHKCFVETENSINLSNELKEVAHIQRLDTLLGKHLLFPIIKQMLQILPDDRINADSLYQYDIT